MRFRPRVFALRSDLDAGGLLARLRSRRGLVALDSAGGDPRRFSLVAFDPVRGIELPSTLLGLRELLGRLRAEDADPVPGPFRGGFLGALSYDLGVSGERSIEVRPDPWRSPRIVGGLYVDFVVRDEQSRECWLVLGGDPPDLEASRREIFDLLAAPEPRAPAPRPLGPLVRWTSAEEHGSRIERAREQIAAGDYYQVNLAHRLTRSMEGDPLDLYRALRARHPAPYMGFLSWEGGALLSASPELLLEFDGTTARTRPIKGTAARGGTPEEDERRARDLLSSEKDLAELAMIVDLERNDLGRVCVPGGVRVERHPHLESYATVHHLSADVVGRPLPGVDAVDLLAALFPGGSVTGAPKLAAMGAIARLEGEGRGFFTGALGFLGLDGRAAFNILIRTLVWRPGTISPGGAPLAEVSFHVGGGITWSSDARAEDDETLTKGAALAAVLDGESGGSPGKKGHARASEGAFRERGPGDRTPSIR